MTACVEHNTVDTSLPKHNAMLAMSSIGTEVAVKRLLWDRFETKLFERECTILQSLRHPNILLFMGYCVEQPNMVSKHSRFPAGVAFATE